MITRNKEIKNEVGRASILEKMKVVSRETCNELCQFMADVKLKSNESSIDTASIFATEFKDSFVVNDYPTKVEIETMAETCIGIDNKLEVIYDIFDDESDGTKKKYL